MIIDNLSIATYQFHYAMQMIGLNSLINKDITYVHVHVATEYMYSVYMHVCILYNYM